jgi:hypothetical protein
MSNKTRSSLKLDAVAQAAALGAASALNPLNKINQVVALAGLVLRLFRSKQPAQAQWNPSGSRVEAEWNQTPPQGDLRADGGKRRERPGHTGSLLKPWLIA